MSTKTLNTVDLSNKALPLTVVFNASDRPDRPADELFKSVKATPVANSTGEFRILGPDVKFYDRRGALNAIERFLFGGDTFLNDGLVHRYSKSNPKNLSGGWGWIHRSLIRGNDASTYRRMMIGTDMYSVELPTRQFEEDGGRKVAKVSIESDWLYATAVRGSTLRLSNAPVDAASGLRFGDILHDFLLDLYNGTQLTVVVTLDILWNKPLNTDGTHQTSNSLQNVAKRVYARLHPVDPKTGKDVEFVYADAIEGYLLDRKGYAAAEQVDKEYRRTVKVEGEVSEETRKGLAIYVIGFDGKSVNTGIADVAPGKYSVVHVDGNGKDTGKVKFPLVVIPTMGDGRNRLVQFARTNGLGLKLVSRFS
jgi:hypothetical protein